MDKQRVWVVDPLDGTREFVQGIPEFCVSIAMVENGIPIAGGICNPATDELILGSRETGVTYNGKPLYQFYQDAYILGITGTKGIYGAGKITPWGVFTTVPTSP